MSFTKTAAVLKRLTFRASDQNLQATILTILRLLYWISTAYGEDSRQAHNSV